MKTNMSGGHAPTHGAITRDDIEFQDEIPLVVGASTDYDQNGTKTTPADTATW